MIRATALLVTGLICACQSDETVAGYGASGGIWQLTEMAGVPFSARATLQFRETGHIVGQAPCNRYSATMTMPYPSFQTGTIASTKAACADLDQETAFFGALASMSQSELLGDTLILRNMTGQRMVFKATG